MRRARLAWGKHHVWAEGALSDHRDCGASWRRSRSRLRAPPPRSSRPAHRRARPASQRLQRGSLRSMKAPLAATEASAGPLRQVMRGFRHQPQPTPPRPGTNKGQQRQCLGRNASARKPRPTAAPIPTAASVNACERSMSVARNFSGKNSVSNEALSGEAMIMAAFLTKSAAGLGEPSCHSAPQPNRSFFRPALSIFGPGSVSSPGEACAWR